jgi:hypothetical protein
MPAESQNSPLGKRDVEYALLFKPVARTELLPITDLIILKPLHHVTSHIVSEDVALFLASSQNCEIDRSLSHV